MAFLRFTRDPRGYENFYLVEPTTNRRGKTRARVLYWFRTPPHVKVGCTPFDSTVREALEQQNPGVEFDWRKILDTPIPSADTEKWRERRRLEKAEKAARRAAEARESEDSAGAEEPPLADQVNVDQMNVDQMNADVSDEHESDAAETAGPEPTEEPTDEDRPPHVLEVAIESAAPVPDAAAAGRRRRRRRRRGRGGRPPEGSAPPVDSAS